MSKIVLKQRRGKINSNRGSEFDQNTLYACMETAQ
jgi:hypothetical protein